MLLLLSAATVCIKIPKFRRIKVDLQHVKSVPLTDKNNTAYLMCKIKFLAALLSEMLLLLWLGLWASANTSWPHLFV